MNKYTSVITIVLSVYGRDGKNPGFFRKTHWGGFNWFYTGLIGFNGQNGLFKNKLLNGPVIVKYWLYMIY